MTQRSLGWTVLPKVRHFPACNTIYTTAARAMAANRPRRHFVPGEGHRKLPIKDGDAALLKTHFLVEVFADVPEAD